MIAHNDLPRKVEGVVYLYTLSDPVTGEVRYVGKTLHPRARLGQHIREVDRGRTTHFKSWVKTLLARGLKPNMAIIETCSPSTWEDRERALIAAHKESNVRLTNTAVGGNQPLTTVEDCRAGAQRTNNSPDVKLFGLIRMMRSAARDHAQRGNEERAAYFSRVAEKIRKSTGDTRNALRAFAEIRV